VHGGVLMAFIDYTLCVVAMGEGLDEGVVTVSCNNEFVDGATAGTLLHGHGEVIRRTGSLVFTRGMITAEDGRVLLNASAIVKRIRRRERRPE
jgi:acyl-coenzyme A thioesterase PaaI-like protein